MRSPGATAFVQPASKTAAWNCPLLDAAEGSAGAGVTPSVTCIMVFSQKRGSIAAGDGFVI